MIKLNLKKIIILMKIIEEDDNVEFEDCIINVKLKKFSDKDGFVIIFNKASGDRRTYYDKVNELKEIAKKLI